MKTTFGGAVVAAVAEAKAERSRVNVVSVSLLCLVFHAATWALKGPRNALLVFTTKRADLQFSPPAINAPPDSALDRTC
jgi:hypothetical protein